MLREHERTGARAAEPRLLTVDYDFQMTRLLEATIRPLLTHFLVLIERIRHSVAYNPTYAALRARSPVHRSLLTHA